MSKIIYGKVDYKYVILWPVQNNFLKNPEYSILNTFYGILLIIFFLIIIPFRILHYLKYMTAVKF